MESTYKITKLIETYPQNEGKTTFLGEGGVKKTLEIVLETVKVYSAQIKEFAKAIEDFTLEQTCYNIWYFLRTQTLYRLDKPGYEEIRTPGRLIEDAIGDCDDYSVFAASVLKELGYKPYFYVVGFRGGSYSHIYVGCEDIVIDGVMNEYNKHPEHITKTMLLQLDGTKKEFNKSPKEMKIERLSGLPGDGETVKHYLLSGHSVANDILDSVEGIDSDGNFYFSSPEMLEAAEEYIEGFEALNGMGSLGDIGKLKDLFNKKKREENKKARQDKREAKKEKRDAKRDDRKENRDAKRDARKENRGNKSGKVTDFVKKNAFAPARGAYLLLLKVNFMKQATMLYIGSLTESQAKAAGYNMTEWKKAKTAADKFYKFWENAGGDKAVLKAAVNKGRGKKVAERSLRGIGEPATAAAATASVAAGAPFWKKIVEFFKGINLKKLAEKVKGVSEIVKEKFSPEEEKATKDVFINNDTTNNDTDNGKEEKNNAGKTIAVVGGVGLALFLLSKVL